MGYYSKLDFDLSFERHLPRLINKKCLFAIEPHKRLFDHFNNTEMSIVKQCEKNEVFIQNLEYLLKNNILNYQLNDNGYKKFSYSYRSLYDTYTISNNLKPENIKINSKFENRYFMVSNELGIDFNTSMKTGVFEQIIMCFYFSYKFYVCDLHNIGSNNS